MRDRFSNNLIWLIALGGLVLGVSVAWAATNIVADSPPQYTQWAWNDVAGWINFYSTNTVIVTSTVIQGYAVFSNSSQGYLALDCATSPNGDICATSNFKVNNDGNGNLSGWAWNDGYGWFSFCGNASGGSTWNGSKWVCPASPTYQVTIGANGVFSGWAWNDVIGWVSFNCNNSGIGNTCGTVDYKVKTSWAAGVIASGTLESSTFDTGRTNGVAFNSFLWQGSLGTGGPTVKVKFQLATANCANGATDPPTCTTNAGWGGSKTSGDGAFVGSDGTSSTYYETSGPGVTVPIQTIYHNNKRYFRYRVYLSRDAGAQTPTVQDIIINWSP